MEIFKPSVAKNILLDDKGLEINDIENILGIKNQTQNDNDINDIEDLLKTKKNTNSNTSQSASDKSLENSILKKINKN